MGDAHNAMFCAFEDFVVKFGLEIFICGLRASDFIVVHDDSRIRKSFFENAEDVAVDAWCWICVGVVVEDLKFKSNFHTMLSFCVRAIRCRDRIVAFVSVHIISKMIGVARRSVGRRRHRRSDRRCFSCCWSRAIYLAFSIGLQ